MRWAVGRRHPTPTAELCHLQPNLNAHPSTANPPSIPVCQVIGSPQDDDRIVTWAASSCTVGAGSGGPTWGPSSQWARRLEPALPLQRSGSRPTWPASAPETPLKP